MNPLLQQFLSESRDFLQGIAEKLMQLEKAPTDAGLMTELFRFVHTLKGNSGLFEFPEMTRVLHAGEDLLDDVRNGRVSYTQDLADRLLDAMDFVSLLIDEIETTGSISSSYASDSARLAESLRRFMLSSKAEADQQQKAQHMPEEAVMEVVAVSAQSTPTQVGAHTLDLAIPEPLRMQAYRLVRAGQSLHKLIYAPLEECFFQGEDPFFQARQTPGLLWGGINAREAWPPLAEMDAYRCLLDFQLLSTASATELADYYRYMAEQISIESVAAEALIVPSGDANGGPVYEDFVTDALTALQADDLASLECATRTMLELSSPDLWFSSALRWLLLVLELDPANRTVLSELIASLSSLTPVDWSVWALQPNAINDSADSNAASLLVVVDAESPDTELSLEQTAACELLRIQRDILRLPIAETWQLGRLQAAANTITACMVALGEADKAAAVVLTSQLAIEQGVALPLLGWLEQESLLFENSATGLSEPMHVADSAAQAVPVVESQPVNGLKLDSSSGSGLEVDADVKYGRRAEDLGVNNKSLKVDQVKIDRLMNLIGEMVVSKNALPYLAGRAETVYGVRELSREIKAQYAVINRIAEEMQDAIMQVRMLPVSFVFQRFSRLVRDTSRKLGKEVQLILEGEDTEADKNIVEALADPLVHIVRNSLDHGFELPETRRAAGKPSAGTLIIRASQESDRVLIDIIDDGKGIDPEVVKRKAYEKGVIDEAQLERISDADAVNLVFAAGFSTAEVISDLSGRGVGMDVVRTAVEKVNGAISLESEKGKGTRIRLSLPLSMAVTNVMIIETDAQIFGVPMDHVVETVRIPRKQLRSIKQSLTTVLRGRIVPIKAMNDLLHLAAEPLANADDELAVLVVRFGEEAVGLLVDDFHETVDIILKPMNGVLADITAYAGSALMGDGSVLMVLNIKELLQ